MGHSVARSGVKIVARPSSRDFFRNTSVYLCISAVKAESDIRRET
jgi:hypothetical protein